MDALRRACIRLGRIDGSGMGFFYTLPVVELGKVIEEVAEMNGK